MTMRGLRVVVALLAGIGLAFASGTGFAQRTEAQKKLAAERVARVDAMRKLVEQLKGMEIMAGTKVVDFALLEDVIKGRTEDVVRGCREKFAPKYYADGTCELTLEVTVAEVTANLKYILKGQYKGDKFKGEEFEELTIKTEKKILEATGTGSDTDLTAPEPAAGGGDTGGLREPPVTGIWRNVPGRERLKAQRAAEMDAKRKLVERVFGTQIIANTTVRDFALENDEINSACRAFIVGATVKRYEYRPDGIVECTVAMPVDEVIMNLKRILEGHYHGDKFHGKDFEQVNIKIDTKDFEEVGKGALGITPQPDVQIKVNVDVEKREVIPPAKKDEGVTIEKKTVVE